jgi:three-Cys-motif partner protein
MTTHKFGGHWTTEKLAILEKYLLAYGTIFKSNPRARYYRTVYIDAFAGTGYRATQTSGEMAMLPDLEQPDTQSYLKGSAVIALESEPPFDHYVFIEQKPDHVAALEQLKQTYPDRMITVLPGDANTQLRTLIQTTDWKSHRAVVFLDPYGMQVEWALLEAIAKTQAIDLWMLFPLGVGVNRLLTRTGEPPKEWGDALTRIFGTERWRDEFYPSQIQDSLFGPAETRGKSATFDSIGRFLVKRLTTIFAGVAPKPLALTNSRNNPLYLLCFAAGNPKGAPIALRIAKHILES